MKKFLRTALVLSIVAGYFLLLGTAGSSDLNLIDESTAIMQSGIGMALLFGGAVGLKRIK